MRFFPLIVLVLGTFRATADIGLVSADGERTWVLYLDGQPAQAHLAECKPPVVRPTRDCEKLATGTFPPSIDLPRFLDSLRLRLRLQNTVRYKGRVDYLQGQLGRIEARIADTATPPSTKEALRTTRDELARKLAQARLLLDQALAASGPAFALYEKTQASVAAGQSWIVDGAERLADYGVKEAGETKVLVFLQDTYRVAPQETLPAPAVPLREDASFDSADAIVPSAYEPGAYAATGNSNQYSHPDRYFQSQLTYYTAQGEHAWEDLSNDFHQAGNSRSVVELGPQKFILIGNDGSGHGALRIVTGRQGLSTPEVEYYYYSDLPPFTTVQKTHEGNLLVAAASQKTFWAVVLSPAGEIQRKARLLDAAEEHWDSLGSGDAAIELSTGEIVGFNTSHQDRRCLVLVITAADLKAGAAKKVQVCEEGLDLDPTAAAATADGNFAVAGRTHRYVPDQERTDDWDWERHRAFIFGFDRNGEKTFEYLTEEVHDGAEGYESLAFNAKSGELAAVGHAPNQGLIDIFDAQGERIAHRQVTSYYNSILTAVAPGVDSRDFWVAGTVGRYFGSGVDYHSALAVIGR